MVPVGGGLVGSGSVCTWGERGRRIPSGVYARTAIALGGQYRKFFVASIAAVLLLQVTIVTDTIIVG
ncbi:MAG: hypothetical protein K6F70_03275 [Eggerthellaceae bacterium]|nr:hypothetical protein [Eggerthellaceae bacterium]